MASSSRRCTLLSRVLAAPAMPLPTPPMAALLILLLASSSGWTSRGGGGSGGAGDLLLASAEPVGAPSAMLKAVDPATTLQCHRRIYSYKVSKSDSAGRKCWDYISVMSCWGRCDSNEISDWRFPYKKSYHPVCMHGDRMLYEVNLRHCDDGAEPGTERYSYYEAVSCVCSVCSSSKASCEGLRYRGQRSSLLYLQGRV